jgi:hypothetical protein
MAKRRQNEGPELPGGRTTGKSPEHPGGRTDAIEDFAEDLGRLLGTARAKAEGWLGQRHNVAKQLEQIHDTAASLLNQLGEATIRRRGRKARGPRKKAMGRRATASGAFPRRKLSAKARAAISGAQKRRWAKLRRETD